MNQQYIYPQNLRAAAKLWLWSLRDVAIIGIAMIISVLALSVMHLYLPVVLTLLFGFMTIRMDDQTVLDYLKKAINYFLTSQQLFFWKDEDVGKHRRKEEMFNQ